MDKQQHKAVIDCEGRKMIVNMVHEHESHEGTREGMEQ
jgi:hypothetical protein